jgi:hypothetical protein
MKEITYDKDILDLVKKLTKLTKQFQITKENDEVSIRVNCDKSVFVDLTFPAKNFDFDGEKIGFVEGAYQKFYEFFSTFKKPSLSQDENKLILRDGNASIKFLLSDPDIIKNGFKGTKKLPDPSVSFKLTKDEFSYIRNMIGMINTENVNFKVTDKSVIISVVNEVTDNSYDFKIDLEYESKEDLDITLKSTIFNTAPELEYTINITQGLFHFQSVNEKFTLNLYTGKKNDK